MPRTPDSDSGPRVRRSYRLRPEIDATIRAHAAATGASETEVIERAVARLPRPAAAHKKAPGDGDPGADALDTPTGHARRRRPILPDSAADG